MSRTLSLLLTALALTVLSLPSAAQPRRAGRPVQGSRAMARPRQYRPGAYRPQPAPRNRTLYSHPAAATMQQRAQRQPWNQPPPAKTPPILEQLRRAARPAAVATSRTTTRARPIRNPREMVRDLRQPPAPPVGIDGRAFHTQRLAQAPSQHLSLVRNAPLIASMSAHHAEELTTSDFFWHEAGGVRYCHHHDRWGHDWYGFYEGPSFYWTRYYIGRWWWFDPGPQQWLYYDSGNWWYQSPAQPQTVYVYMNGGYAPATVATAAEAVATEKTPAEPKYSSDVDAPNYRANENENSFALVVGVEDYSRLPKAQFARRDAQTMRAHLAALGYPERNIISLTDADAVRSGLTKYVETWLPQQVKSDSRVFVYFSGHGAPDPKTGDTYLMPWDGDPKYLADTGYPLARLFAQLNALPSRNVVVTLDSCFSGAGGRSVIVAGTRPLVTRIKLNRAAVGELTVFTASGADEVTGVAPDQGHGLFTYYFLKGLNGAAHATAQGVTVQDLYDYLRPKVEDAARVDNRDQSPQLFIPPDGQRGMLIKDLR